MTLLSPAAPVWLDGTGERKSFKLYKAGSAEKHAASDSETLRKALQQALNAKVDGSVKTDQGGGVFRYKINNKIGYLVYKLGVDGEDSACMFHYHWNYTMDLDLSVY
jgi:hypothetical protein